jgi:hypothetical protein
MLRSREAIDHLHWFPYLAHNRGANRTNARFRAGERAERR